MLLTARRVAPQPTVAWPSSRGSHSHEVTGVAWSPIDLGTLATASDDQTVRVWSVDRELGRLNSGPHSAWRAEPPEEASATQTVAAGEGESAAAVEAAPLEKGGEAARAGGALVTPTTSGLQVPLSSAARPGASKTPDLRHYFARVSAGSSSSADPAAATSSASASASASASDAYYASDAGAGASAGASAATPVTPAPRGQPPRGSRS